MTYLKYKSSLRLAALSLLASLYACSSDNSDGGGTGGTSGNGTGGTSGATTGSLVGTFLAELVPPLSGANAFTKFIGVVFDGPVPPSMPLKLDSEKNGCQLMVPQALFCSPSCGAAGVCTAENVCTPYPTAQNLGVVHVTGLGPTEVVMDPMPTGYNYQPSMTLPYPSCNEDGAVKVSSDKLTIDGKCIAPLTLLGADPVPIASGKGVPLTWTPPGKAGISRIKIKLDIAHHGGKKGEIDCDVPDTGSFEIPETLITKLVSLGLAGFPTIVVNRQSSASAPTQSQVNLVVSSSIERSVDSGVKSCTDNSECTAPQVCRADLSCGPAT
jgi:hypothetical protein